MSTRSGIAVVGAGRLGSFHARALHRLDPAQPAWIVDTVPARAQALAAELDARATADLAPVLAQVGAVVVATSTAAHFAVADAALVAGCDVLVEKPLTATLAEGEALVARARAQGAVLQVGHSERFNPIFRLLRAEIGTPAFVEAERLAPFVPRSLDIDVVLDLMIHDLDLLLALMPDDPVAVDAVGVAVLTAREDIANVRLRFAGGTVANLTASRVSQDRVRKIRFFHRSGYLSLDLMQRTARRIVLRPVEGEAPAPAGGIPDTVAAGPALRAVEERIQAPEADPLTDQLRAFLAAAAGSAAVEVGGAEGLRVLRVAEEVRRQVRRSLECFGAAS